MNEDKDNSKSIRVMPETHRLLYLRWKKTGMGIKAQIKELVDNSRKYAEFKEVRNA